MRHTWGSHVAGFDPSFVEKVREGARKVFGPGKYIDLSQLGICPQCGFASTVGGNDVTLEDQIAKLRLLTSTAQQVWGSA